MLTAILFVYIAASSVRALAPSCVVFFGDDGGCLQHVAETWISAAQDEAARHYHTINGAWLPAECVVGRTTPLQIDPAPIDWKHLLCIPISDIPEEKCSTKHCNFALHPELTTNDECITTPVNGDACRTIRSWIKIANEKLYKALNYFDSCDYENAISYACAADYIFSFVADYLVSTQPVPPPRTYVFLDSTGRANQKFTHVNGKAQRISYTLRDASLFETSWRAVQSILSCTNSDPSITSNVTSLIFVPNVLTEVTTDVDIQLFFAATGVVPGFKQLFKDVNPSNDCAMRDEQIDDIDAVDLDRRLEQLTLHDYAVVQYDGKEPRSYLNLGIQLTCPGITVLADIDPKSRKTSVTHVNLYHRAAVVDADEFASKTASAVVFIDASVDGCDAYISSGTLLNPACADKSATAVGDVQAMVSSFTQLPDGIPLTLAPDESRCVGGDRAGSRCTMESECEPGWSCQRKPFSPHDVAYCYNGEEFDMTQLCAFPGDDEECPNGACWGSANGNDGGAYPFYYFYTENDCAQNTGDAVCRDERVSNWVNYRNPNVFGATK